MHKEEKGSELTGSSRSSRRSDRHKKPRRLRSQRLSAGQVEQRVTEPPQAKRDDTSMAKSEEAPTAITQEPLGLPVNNLDEKATTGLETLPQEGPTPSEVPVEALKSKPSTSKGSSAFQTPMASEEPKARPSVVQEDAKMSPTNFGAVELPPHISGEGTATSLEKLLPQTETEPSQTLDRVLGSTLTGPAEISTLPARTGIEESEKARSNVGVENSKANQENFLGLPQVTGEVAREGELLSLAALLVVITAAVLVIFFVVQSALKRQVCTTKPCQSFDKLLGESINASINPCDSFGRYVCDGWRTRNVFSVRETIFQTALDATVRSVQNAVIPDTSQNAGEQTAALFLSCCKAQGDWDMDETSLVRAYLTEAGVTWPWVPVQPDVLETSMFLAFELGWPAVLDFELVRDSRTSTVVINPARSFTQILGAELQLWDEGALKKYFEALVELFSGGDGTANVTFSDVQDTDLLMEKRLRRALVRNWTRLKVKNLHPGAEAWTNAFAKRNITGSLQLVSSSSSFVGELIALWTEYGEDRMHLYISWCAVRYVARFTNNKLFSYIGQRLNSTISTMKACLLFTHDMVGDAVFVPYTAQVFLPGVRADVAKLVTSVRKAFAQRFQKNSLFSTDLTMITEWASVSGVFETIDYRLKRDLSMPFKRYQDMKSSFVRNWRSLSTFRYLIDKETPTHNAVDAILKDEFYSISKNSKDFVLLPFTLTFPMYHIDMSVAIKYGTLATLLARASAEIVLKNYSTQTSTGERIADAQDCFARDARILPMAPRDDVMLEVVALEAALDAFEAAVEDARKGRDGLGVYSAVEAFFLSWCFTQCTAPATPRSADVDPCSAPLRHVQRFSDAFGCQPETSLNPLYKCNLF